MQYQAGQVALFGSGETSLSGGRVFEALACALPAPLRIAVLETPAGFEPNSAQVAGRVAEFINLRLQNYHPRIDLVPARKKGTSFSPDDPGIVRPLAQANMIFLGPGSPTYTVRQLENSLAWHTLVARHRMGATVVMASAATIAAGAMALPVYEIYKVGEDPHWHAGLNFFGPYGLSLVFIPHWNNTDGGADLDTSRCFMGQARFARLLAMLPAEAVVVGIDEHTALVVDLQAATCRAMGAGSVHVLRAGRQWHMDTGQAWPVHELGAFRRPDPQAGLPAAAWNDAMAASRSPAAVAPDEVRALVEQRQAARARRDWAAADSLRQHAEALGWNIKDTLDGPVVEPSRKKHRE